MRDIAITVIVIYGLIMTMKRAYVGVLLWSWLSYMNPHRLAYGFAYSMPFAYITAIALFISTIVEKEKKKIPFTPITFVWIVFILYMGLTTINAYYFDIALERYIQVVKQQVVIFFAMALLTDIKKIDQLIWVMVISIGYFSAKGGLFTILTGGAHRVWGPPDSLVEGNNELAVATLMVIPLMVYLSVNQSNKTIKKMLNVAIALSFIGVLGSQSRGALIAIVAVAFNFWRKSDKKMIVLIMIAVAVPLLLAFLPETWFDRMNTIKTYDQDASAMGRINAWYYAFNAANDRILGMGFDSWTSETFSLYAPDPNDHHAAHSIYFSALGDHGWPGLIFFLFIFLMSARELIKILKNVKCPPQIKFLAKMLQISMIAYMTGGAFLSLTYFDLAWGIVGIILCLQRIVEENEQNVVTVRKSQLTKKMSVKFESGME